MKCKKCGEKNVPETWRQLNGCPSCYTPDQPLVSNGAVVNAPVNVVHTTTGPKLSGNVDQILAQLQQQKKV